MLHKQFSYYLEHLSEDIPAGLVVFLVALPLCLGIALASGAPPFAGVIAGVIGGLVVSLASGSQLSVSGPAAGLTVIVATAIEKIGFQGLLLAVVIAGALQIAMGYLRAGVIGAYFPSTVIKGMLAAIGLILIMKQLPHAIGFDAGGEDDLSALDEDRHLALPAFAEVFSAFSPGATIVTIVSIGIMLYWESAAIKSNKWLRLVPGALVAVVFGVAFQTLVGGMIPSLAIASDHLVNMPKIFGPAQFAAQFTFPDFSQALRPEIYLTAGTLALIASLETLLSLEAVDKLDPLKRTAPTNQELKAQGLGNMLSGLLGGLPITAVIVRSSANIDAGGHTKVSCFVHGVMLALSAMFLSTVLNLIPLACLAAVLLLTGYKLAKPKLFMEVYKSGFNQFGPFIITVVAILATDLLKGMMIGMAIGLFFVLRANYHSAFSLTRDGKNYLLRLQKDVSFLNKAPLRAHLESIDEDSYLIVDGSRASFIDHDILETIQDFVRSAPEDRIHVELRNVRGLSPANGSGGKAEPIGAKVGGAA